VLVVEDEPLVRMLTAHLLRRAGGFDVLEARTGDEALDFLANGHDVALMLTDIRMKGINGIDLARRVRSSHPKLPILFVTGEKVLGAPELDSMKCLNKPLAPEVLIAAANEAIRAANLD